MKCSNDQDTKRGQLSAARGRRVGVLGRSRVRGCLLVTLVALTLGACSSGRAPGSKTARAEHRSSSVQGTSHLSAKEADTPAAVIQAWRAAEQTVYRYDREPWRKIRAELIADTPPLAVFPDLGRYFTGPALSAVVQSVVGIKMDELTGAKVDRLGDPVVTALHGRTATVSSCGYDSGTTTADGQPGPATLDGGAGYGQGTWTMSLTEHTWKIVSGEAVSVRKC